MSTAAFLRYRESFLAFAEDTLIPGPDGLVRFGDVMTDFQRDAIQNWEPSLLAVAAGKRPLRSLFWHEWTKGAGKGLLIAMAILWVLIFASRAVLIQIGAADLEQAGESIKELRQLLRLNAHCLWASLIEVQKFRVQNNNNGAACEILSSDGASAHGSRPDLVIIDELCHHREQTFAETLMDNAAKMPNAVVIIATNAGFVGTWQHRWREQARASERWFFQKMDFPAPWIDQGILEEARRRNSPARYGRLYEGRWAAEGGDTIDAGDILASRRLSGPEDRADGESWHLVGVDRSLRRDRTAVVVVAVLPGSRSIRVVWCRSWRPSGVDPERDEQEVERTIVEANVRFRPVTVRFDPFGMDTIAYRCRRQGVPMSPCPFAGNNLDDMARAMMQAFKDRLVATYNDEALLRDLAALTIQENRAGFGYRLVATRTEEGHADAAMALATVMPAAVRIANQGRPGARPRGQKPQLVASTPGNVAPLLPDGTTDWARIAQIKQAARA